MNRTTRLHTLEFLLFLVICLCTWDKSLSAYNRVLMIKYPIIEVPNVIIPDIKNLPNRYSDVICICKDDSGKLIGTQTFTDKELVLLRELTEKIGIEEFNMFLQKNIMFSKIVLIANIRQQLADNIEIASLPHSSL